MLERTAFDQIGGLYLREVSVESSGSSNVQLRVRRASYPKSAMRFIGVYAGKMVA
jgi:hypothetical protein